MLTLRKNFYTGIFLIILLVGGFLRFTGLKPGYHKFHSDENFIYSNAVEFIKNKNFEPFRFDYPTLTPTINYLAFKFYFIPKGWVSFYFKNLGMVVDGYLRIPPSKVDYDRISQIEILGPNDSNVIFWSRYVTAFFGSGIIFLVYLVAGKLFGKKVGLLSSLLVAVNYRQVLNSHFALPDIYNAFFLLLSFYFTLKLRENPSIRWMFLTGVACGLALSVKYQVFPLIPPLVVYLERAVKTKSLNLGFSIIPLGALFIFWILNPRLLINWERAYSDLSTIGAKYRVGKNFFDFYSISYLYKIGIGRVTSILTLLGIMLGLVKERAKTLILLSLLIPFFYVFVYFTGGGFYTRNFVSITPFALIFAGFALSTLSFKPKTLAGIVLGFLLLFSVSENLTNSVVVLKEYTKPWNFTIIESWIVKNIKPKTKIAAHSSVPVPNNMVRINYDLEDNFTMEEFRRAGASYAIANLDWVNVDFYWWMTQPFKKSSLRWRKPVEIMKKMFASLAIDEVSDYSIYSVMNSWQAPDHDFIVAKVPYYKVLNKEKIKEYKNNIGEGWNSEVMEVTGWSGFFIDYKIKTETTRREGKDGFLVASFYESLDDVKKDKKLAVRLSDRNVGSETHIRKNYVGKVPFKANYMLLSVQVYDKAKSKVELEHLAIYKTEVIEDLEGVNVRKIIIPENNLFPNSHGNL